MIDFSELINEASKCVNCGFCESVCPTLPAADFLPSRGARGRVELAKFMYKYGEINPVDAFYSCVDCYACLSVCPAGVNAGKVSEIGRSIIVKNGRSPEIARMIVKLTMMYKNPLGVMAECSKWAEGLNFDENDTLLYTGNMYQLMAYLRKFSDLRKRIGSNEDFMARIIEKHPSIIKFAKNVYDKQMMEKMSHYLKNIVKILKKNDFKFSYLRDEEPYPGTFIYDLGYEDEFREYAKSVVDLFRKHGFKKIITIDPHTYEILKYIYPKYVKFDFDVVYYLDIIAREKVKGRFAVHTPCHFSRYFSFDAYIGDLMDIEAESNPTKCCGGPDELLFPDLALEISSRRFKELKLKGLPIVTACPICYSNLAKDDSVVDISEIIVDHM